MIPNGTRRTGIRSPLALCCLAGLLAAGEGVLGRGQPLQPCKPQPKHHPGHLIPQNLEAFLLQNGFCTLYIPEYNDVQRLWDKQGGYGPIAWGFARPGLDAHTSHVPFDNQPVLVTVVGVGTGSLPQVYQKLGLGNGIYCVFLQHIHAPAPTWDAVVVQETAGTCDVTAAGGRHLPVVPDPAVPNAYPPPVTRFVESIKSGVNEALIGVRCGSDWCNIGTQDPATIPPPAHQAVASAADPPQWKIKGWFDDQTLGDQNISPLGIFPAYRASLIPDRNLGSYTINSFRKKWFISGWKHVATLFWPPSAVPIPKKYLDGYGLQHGKNELELRLAGNVWEARIKNALHPNGFALNVVRTPHPGFAVPATARWVWSDTDEEIWVACDVGCCWVQGVGGFTGAGELGLPKSHDRSRGVGGHGQPVLRSRAPLVVKGSTVASVK